jgi:hypothetical protein
MPMIVTDEMISAALNAPTGGDEHSYICDYITTPDSNDPDWKAIGVKVSATHSHIALVDWQWHIAKVMLEAALKAADKS